MSDLPTLLVYCDPDLGDGPGHNSHHARAVLAAAAERGLPTVAVVNVFARQSFVGSEVRRRYTHSSWDRLSVWGYRSHANTVALEARFIAETAPVLESLQGMAPVVVLIPNGFLHHLGACERLARRFQNCRFDILFRYERAFFDTPYARRWFARAEHADLGDRLILSTDSHRLRYEIGGLTRMGVRVHPIPHVVPEDYCPPGFELGNTAGRPMVICHLGNARVEKGFGHVARAMAAARTLPFPTCFHLQTSDPDAQSLPVVAGLNRTTKDGHVTYPGALAARDYFGILASSDISLLPYDAAIYFARTSGLALDSMLVGTPVIVPNHTWMADIVKRYGNGLILDRVDDGAICHAITQAREVLPELRRAAAAARLELAAVHNPTQFVGSILARASSAFDQRRERRAAIIFPWGDLLKRQSGAAYRFAEMLAFLETHYDNVRVLYLGGEPGAFTSRTFCEAYNNRHWYMNPLRFILVLLCYLMRLPYGDVAHLWLFWMARRDDVLRLRCEELAHWADDVFAEYPYLSPLLEEPCANAGSRLFTTLHDILSAQVRTPALRRLTQRVEISAIRRGGTVIVLSAEEGQALRKHGIVARHVPTPFAPQAAAGLPSVDAARSLLLRRHGLAVAGRAVVMFVGSAFGPNIEAAQHMRQASRDYRGQHLSPTPLFVVAGACHDPCLDASFVALGPVTADVIEALYSVASVVVVPLRRGTGVSIKVIEALSRGKAIVATSVGVRGLPVTSGKHCVIHDDLATIGTVLRAVIDCNELREHLEIGAKSFASEHNRERFAEILAKGIR